VRRPASLLLLAAIAASHARDASAETIQLVILSQSYLSADGLEVRLDVRNNGDTAARNVLPIAAFRGTETLGAFVADLAPAASLLQTISIPLTDPARLRGVWPLFIRVSYVDGNNHAFEALHAVTVAFRPEGAREEAAPPTPVTVTLSADAVSTTGQLSATLTSTLSGNATVSFVVPEGLAVTPEQANVFLEPGTRRLSAIMTNAGATESSRLPAFAVLEYEIDGLHATTIASSVVDIVAPRETGARWTLAAVLTALFGAWILLAIRSRRRRSHP
jgi:hypothetical protein